MAKTITKIALTGGPCAGKSTGLSRIIKRISQLDYKVLIVSETPTELFMSGVEVGEHGLTNQQFQSLVLEAQIEKEKRYEKVASLVPQKKVLIVCDRGAMDGKAYCSKAEFSKACRNLQTDEIHLRDEYDAVFHLKTAADGAEAFYTILNNQARKETPEEARILDQKTIRAWIGHPHLQVIGNETDFETKINRLVAGILKFLGEPVPLEIERKFLIKMPNIEQLISEFHAEKLDIVQTYLKSEQEGEEVRIRQRGKDGHYVYFLTTKKSLSGLTRVETEKRISLDEYLKSLMIVDTSLRPIKKERYCFIYRDQYFELDIYPFWNNQAILEIELTEENQTFSFPDFIEIIKEVTDNSNYKNYALAQKVPTEQPSCIEGIAM